MTVRTDQTIIQADTLDEAASAAFEAAQGRRFTRLRTDGGHATGYRITITWAQPSEED